MPVIFAGMARSHRYCADARYRRGAAKIDEARFEGREQVLSTVPDTPGGGR